MNSASARSWQQSKPSSMQGPFFLEGQFAQNPTLSTQRPWMNSSLPGRIALGIYINMQQQKQGISNAAISELTAYTMA